MLSVKRSLTAPATGGTVHDLTALLAASLDAASSKLKKGAEKPAKYDKLNDRQLKGLVDAHCGLYEGRLRRAGSATRLNAPASGIRVDECQKLLGIWRSIGTKLSQGNWRLRLTNSEVNEIRDAISSGDFDAMLRSFGDPPS